MGRVSAILEQLGRLVEAVRVLEDRVFELESSGEEQLPSVVGFEAGDDIDFDEEETEYKEQGK